MTRSASTGGSPSVSSAGMLPRHVTHDDRDRAALPEQVDPEIAELGDAEREVHLLRLFEGLAACSGLSSSVAIFSIISESMIC
jgi:hypothetical protein